MDLPLPQDGSRLLPDLIERRALEVGGFPYRQRGGGGDGGRADQCGAISESLQDADVEVGGEAGGGDGWGGVRGWGAVDFGGEGDG